MELLQQYLRKMESFQARQFQSRILINNEWVDSVSGKTFPTYYPCTEEKIADVAEGDVEDIHLAVQAARKAFPSWSKTSGAERCKLIRKLADLIESNAEEIARLESLNSGKPLDTHAKFMDVPVSIKVLRYFAGWADKMQGHTVPVQGNYLSFTRDEPIGVVGIILSFSFPLVMLATKLAPALAAGCTVVIKPAEQTPLSALRIGELAIAAGFPPGVINIVPGYGPTAGQALARHMQVNKITFTGSTEVGRLMMKYSAESNLKRVGLDLGGKSPSIVFADADLEAAISTTHIGMFFNMGQVHMASSRIYVEESVYDQFVTLSVAAAQRITIGESFDKGVGNTSLIDQEHLDKVLAYIEVGKKEGARLVCGGKRIGNKGFYVEPTIFADVEDNMRIARDEIMGPVMCIMKFKTVEEVIDRANNSHYGLAAAVFTKDVTRALNIANGLQAGTVWVNCWNVLDPGQPYGGFKESGLGREYGEEGLKSYTETKSVVVSLKGPGAPPQQPRPGGPIVPMPTQQIGGFCISSHLSGGLA